MSRYRRIDMHRQGLDRQKGQKGLDGIAVNPLIKQTKMQRKMLVR
jgi:hypothetical protein